MLAWLERQPGDSWQDRWFASGADAEGNIAWRRLPAGWLAETGRRTPDSEGARLTLSRGMSLLVCGDLIRPSLGWLMTPGTPRDVVTEIARPRDPDGFAKLDAICRDADVNVHTSKLALRRVASIVAARGGMVADIVIGDCLELLRVAEDQAFGRPASSPYFYQLLRAAGVFAGTGPTVRGLRTQGQLGCEQLIDRYSIKRRPVRDLLVDYLRERQTGLDYASLHKLSYTLGRLFWRPGRPSPRDRLAAPASRRRVGLETASGLQDRPPHDRRADHRGVRAAGQRRRSFDDGAGFLSGPEPMGQPTTRPGAGHG